MKLRKILTAIVASVAIVSAGIASAADWKPSGPLKMQIGFGAGGSTDTMGRVLAKVMKEQTGWNIIAENKTGGGGVAMFTGIANMPAKGNIIGLGVNMPILVNLVRRGDELKFNLDSFDYLGTIAKAELALVATKDAPFDDLEGLIAYAKEKGVLPIAFDAPPQKLVMGVTTRTTGAKFNMVTTKSGAETMKLILGGQVLAGFGSGEQLPYLKSGDMKVIAGANQSRLSYAPDNKTFVESGVNAYVDPYFFLATTKGTAPEAVTAIAAAIDNAMKSEEIAKIVNNATNGSPLNLGPEGTKKMLVDGIDNVKVLFAK
jgi:tripartite-type tricarboxylate transporter receptor subunit TctC